MSMIRGLVGALAVAIWVAPAGVWAQTTDDVTEGETATGPEAASTSVVVDEEQAELERMQRDAEMQGQPDASAAVVEAEPEEPAAPEDSLHHSEQVGLRAGIAVPFIFAIKYADGPKCDEDGSETFCRRLGATLLDLELSFGVSQTVELSILGRFGLVDDDAAEANPLAFGFGARAYGSPDSMVKLFFGGRVMLDLTSSDVMEWNTVDVGLRGELGLQIDFVRYAGMYVQVGETIAVLRGLYFKTDAGIGAQFRFP